MAGRLGPKGLSAWAMGGLGLLAVLALPLGTLGCVALNPAIRYQEAARQLRFSLDRVEPKLELAFPLEESRLRLRLEVGVDNPTGQALRTREVSGEIGRAHV